MARVDQPDGTLHANSCGSDLQAHTCTAGIPSEVSPVPAPLKESAPMLDIHAPHDAVHTWKGFVIHIATIVVGLFIAVGLEQTVEFFHHQHQSKQLEEQLHEVFESNLQLFAFDLKELTSFRAYLAELRAAIIARRQGQSSPAAPATNDTRITTFARFPSLAPYEVAKQTGTIALLSGGRIRLYNRLDLQHDLLATARESWFDGLADMQAFQERFVDSTGSLALGEAVTTPDLGTLSPAELSEYQTVIAAVMKKTDLFVARLHLFDVMCRAVLSGVRNDDEFVRYLEQHVPDLH